MAKVLGIVASDRKLGNSEVLVKEALFGAREAGAKVELMRLSDYRLENCNGCMSCAFKKSPGVHCPIDDDGLAIFNQILAASGIIIGAPTYFLGPIARIKTLLDRAMMVAWDEAQQAQRTAAVIAVAGLRGWDGLAVPILSELALALGARIVGTMNAYAPGPGQTLLDPDNVSRAHELGTRVVSGEALPVPAGRCPICRSTIFTPVGFSAGGHTIVQCPLCGVRGEITCPAAEAQGHSPEGRDASRETGFAEVDILFDPETVASHRWTPENLRRHLAEWVVPTREMFLRDLRAVKEARKRYQDPI